MNRHFSTPATKTYRPGPRIWIPLGCAVLCVVVIVPWVALAAGGGGGFDGVVSSIESRYHVHATRIPFMGLASVVAWTATHGGVDGVKVADFEHFSTTVDGDELNQLVEEKLGQGWEPMIRETSRHGGEQTLIFAHPERRRMALFILDLNGRELDVVQVSVDPRRLSETIGKYGHHHRDGGDESD